jgi:hypothetical protein
MQMHQKFPCVYWGMCGLCRYKLIRSRRELSKLTDLCNMAMVQIVATPLTPHKSADFVCCANNPTAKYNSRLNPYMQKQQTAFGIRTSCKQMSLVLIMHKWQFPQTLIIPKIRCANGVQQGTGYQWLEEHGKLKVQNKVYKNKDHVMDLPPTRCGMRQFCPTQDSWCLKGPVQCQIGLKVVQIMLCSQIELWQVKELPMHKAWLTNLPTIRCSLSTTCTFLVLGNTRTN